MEWIERLNAAVNYIEENLTETVDLDGVAKIACCSTYHFQRMFTYMADVPLSEYIRRRKMSLAAAELQTGKDKVIDLSLKYGYESPTAFNRAFKAVQGISPTEARKSGVVLKSFPPISFKITIKGASEMNYRIEKKDGFRIIGISEPLETEIEKNFEAVPKMWGKAAMDGTIEKLAGLMNSSPMGVLGVSACGSEEQWRYYIAVASTEKEPEGFETYTVPESTWAIFSGEGNGKSVQDLEKRIVTEWLPTSGYEYANAPDVEVYLTSGSENVKYEVWIPVVKK